jgi:hypothetical protein
VEYLGFDAPSSSLVRDMIVIGWTRCLPRNGKKRRSARRARERDKGDVMTLPSVDKLVAGLDQKRHGDVGEAHNRLFNPYGIEKLIPNLIEAFTRIKSWKGRNHSNRSSGWAEFRFD